MYPSRRFDCVILPQDPMEAWWGRSQVKYCAAAPVIMRWAYQRPTADNSIGAIPSSFRRSWKRARFLAGAGQVGDVIVGGVLPPPGDTLWAQSRWIAQDQTLRNFMLNKLRGGVSSGLMIIQTIQIGAISHFASLPVGRHRGLTAWKRALPSRTRRETSAVLRQAQRCRPAWRSCTRGVS